MGLSSSRHRASKKHRVGVNWGDSPAAPLSVGVCAAWSDPSPGPQQSLQQDGVLGCVRTSVNQAGASGAQGRVPAPGASQCDQGLTAKGPGPALHPGLSTQRAPQQTQVPQRALRSQTRRTEVINRPPGGQSMSAPLGPALPSQDVFQQRSSDRCLSRG